MTVLPSGSEIIINTLLSLNTKNEDSFYNKNVRTFARYGIVFIGSEECYSFCPFCYINRRPCIFRNPKSHYGHSEKCENCIIFRKYLEQLNSNILSYIADFLACYNISINAICSLKFYEILKNSNPLIRCIKRSDLRAHIYKLFEKFQSEITRENLGEFCSILLDGSTRNLKNYYGFIIFSIKRLFYFKIEKLENSTSLDISLATREIINYLHNEINVEVISVCSDHASNMIKAFNLSDQVSCQIISDSFFEWVGCCCHLFNLGISDLDSNSIFSEIKNTLHFILSISSKIQLPQKVPSFCKTRWDSYSKCFNYVLLYSDQIISYLSSTLNSLFIKNSNLELKIQRYQKNNFYLISQQNNLQKEILIYQKSIQLLKSNEFDEITTLFTYMPNLISKIGSDDFLLYKVYPEIIAMIDFFTTLSTENIKKFSDTILNRIFSSDEYIQILTSYFLTIEGHNYFLNDVNEEERNEFFSIIKNYLIYYNGCKFGDCEEILIQQIENFINFENFETFDSYQYWETLRGDQETARLAEIAIRILQMPCSEASVERLFSHLKYLFGKKNYNLSDDILNAQLGIRLGNIYGKEK